MAWRVPTPAVCPYHYSIYNWHSPPHPNSYTWKQHNNPGLTEVHIPFPYLLPPSDLEYSGLAAIAERSWPNTMPGNKGPLPSWSASRRHPIWPISASHQPRPLPKHEMARRRPLRRHHKYSSGWFGEVQHWKPFLTQKIIYHGQSVENNLLSNPSQGKKNWQLALSNLQHGHWESFIFPLPSPGLDAFRREDEEIISTLRKPVHPTKRGSRWKKLLSGRTARNSRVCHWRFSVVSVLLSPWPKTITLVFQEGDAPSPLQNRPFVYFQFIFKARILLLQE